MIITTIQFKNRYQGDEGNEKQILNWLTDEETLKIIGIIDEVSFCRNKHADGTYPLVLQCMPPLQNTHPSQGDL